MVEKTGILRLSLTRAEAFNASHRVIRSLGAEITRSDDQAGLLLAKFPMTIRSAGEQLAVNLSGTDGEVLLTVTSRSSLPTTLFDFGKNIENVRRFVTDPAFDSSVLVVSY